MTDCSICINPVVDHPALGATGSHRSSCGHIFHPKCIAKWHSSHWKSTCPLCRKDATELEDCAPKPETAAALAPPAFPPGAEETPAGEWWGTLAERVSTAAAAAVAHVNREQRQREIATELASLSAELSSLVQPLPVPLAEAQLPPLHYIDHPCALEFFRASTIPPSYGPETEVMCNACNQPCGTNPFYHCGNCEFDVCLPCFVDGAARGFMQRIGL
jgi:hypothetical protein